MHNFFLFTANECRLLDPLQNGVIEADYDLNSVATYKCNERYRLYPEGRNHRTCTEDGWDGFKPACGMCVMHIELMSNNHCSSSNYSMEGRL